MIFEYDHLEDRDVVGVAEPRRADRTPHLRIHPRSCGVIALQHRWNLAEKAVHPGSVEPAPEAHHRTERYTDGHVEGGAIGRAEKAGPGPGGGNIQLLVFVPVGVDSHGAIAEVSSDVQLEPGLHPLVREAEHLLKEQPGSAAIDDLGPSPTLLQPTAREGAG